MQEISTLDIPIRNYLGPATLPALETFYDGPIEIKQALSTCSSSTRVRGRR